MQNILDVCCGSKMFYYDKNDKNVLFLDIRREKHILCDGRKLDISPDVVADFRNLPFANESFQNIVFDPPHMKTLGQRSWMAKKYGRLSKENWKQDLKSGFEECWRVLKNGGSLVFKWNDSDIKASSVLKIFGTNPTLGQKRGNKTKWFVFYKNE